MQIKKQRVKEKTYKEKLLTYLHKYSYLETLIFMVGFLAIGYLIDSNDICMFDSEIPFLLILLAIITLFHGFENGILGLTIASVSMMIFYDTFPYIDFLVTLLMTLVYSEFHYYWTQKIKQVEVESNYRGEKLNELSKAFYSLKISHDQLEKNYVVKPMSIRNALNQIIQTNKEAQLNNDVTNSFEYNYQQFLDLVQKSFNVNSGLIIHRKAGSDGKFFQPKVVDVTYGEYTEKIDKDEIFKNYLVDKAIARKTAVYISDENGEPSLEGILDSRYIAAIPALYNDEIISVLVIEKMPFMAFDRENLTSIAILLEYFTIELYKTSQVIYNEHIEFIQDTVFKFELARLNTLYTKFKVNSILLVMKVDDELQAIRLHDQVKKILRSLDMAAFLEDDGVFFIPILFPLHDKAAALGFLNRFIGMLDENDKRFLYMTFDLSRLDLFEKYIKGDK
jgi:hypothetical protein